MLDPMMVMLPAGYLSGGYELFSYKGISADGQKAFWLRYVIQKQNASKRFNVEVSVTLFDRNSCHVQTLYEHELIDANVFKNISKTKRWDNFRVNFQSGSFIELSGRTVRGKLFTSNGNASWDLIVKREDKPLLSLGNASYYQLPGPFLKSAIPDSASSFKGRIYVADDHCAGDFNGFSQHVWGSGSIKSGARVSCTQFKEQNIVFEALCGQLVMMKNSVVTPMLTLATLQVGENFYEFNELASIKKNRIETLDNYRWKAIFKNEQYRLEMDVDGGNPRAAPWVAFHCDFLNHKRKLTKQTPFAAGRLRLFDHDDQLIADLRSDYFDLETLLSRNSATGEGLIATP